MSTPLIVALGAFAGLTVFLGLPFARLKNLPNSMQAFLNACATGILMHGEDNPPLEKRRLKVAQSHRLEHHL